MKIQSFLKKLRDFGKDVEDNIENLNWGGCGVYAYLFAQRLKELGIETACFTSISSYRNEPKTNVEEVSKKLKTKNYITMKDWYEHDVEFNHVGVVFWYNGETYLHDTEKTVKYNRNFKDFILFEGFLDIDDVKNIAIQPDNWNTDFDREQIPLLKEMIQQFTIEEREDNGSFASWFCSN